MLGTMSPTLAIAAPPLPIPIPSAPAADTAHTYQIRRVGSFEVAPLSFQGVRLFEVTAPALQDPKAFPPVAARIDVIQDNLNQIVPPPSTVADIFRQAPTRYDPDTFRVKVVMNNGYWTLNAADNRGSVETPLLTVTELDAKYNGVPQDQLARSWADILQTVLSEALRSRAPGALQKQVSSAALAVLAAILLTVLITFARTGLARLRARLEAPVTEPSTEEDVEPDEPERPWWWHVARFTLQITEWLLGWAVLAVWVAALLWALHQIGPTQAFARRITVQLVQILAVWFVASVVIRLGTYAIARFAHVWKTRPFGLDEDAARRKMRAKTVRSALEYTMTTVIFLAAIAVTLSVLGASASAVVVLGAAVAFAVSFGAQSLVKDFVNGVFILIEDQYAIGDFVTVGNVKGLVDTLTLRITQLRADDGRLVTIPNGQVSVVENWTRNFSRVDYRIAVAFDCDIDKALRAFGGVLNELAADPQWRSSISEPPRVLGVESVSSTGAVLLGQIRTAPGKMFEVTREINRRMLFALVQQGIPLGMPISRAAQSATAATRPDSQQTQTRATQ